MFIPPYYERQKAKGHGRFTATLMLPYNAVKYVQRKLRPKKRNPRIGYHLYKKPLLVSYPRSGTNWIRYIIEWISGAPTPGQKRLHTGSDFIIDRAHRAYLSMDKYKKVVFLIRDYRECLIRHNTKLWLETQQVSAFLTDESVRMPASYYVKNIQAFDKFRGAKLLIYYEDLISSPEVTIRALSQFLELDTDRTETFISTIETRSTESADVYTAKRHKSNTRGNFKDFDFHARKHLTVEQKVEFDEFYRENYPTIFQKYLMRYASS